MTKDVETMQNLGTNSFLPAASQQLTVQILVQKSLQRCPSEPPVSVTLHLKRFYNT